MWVETATWCQAGAGRVASSPRQRVLLSVLRPVSPRLVPRRCGNCLAGQLGSIELLGRPVNQVLHPLKLLKVVVGGIVKDESRHRAIVSPGRQWEEIAHS